MEKRYDFDTPVERHHTDCVKYDLLESLYGDADLMPMWVADMDFRSPDFVMEALRRRLDHEVMGYAIAGEGYYKAVTGWLIEHYGITARREELHFIPGIVAGISFALQALTVPGDKVLVTTPVYPPFLNVPPASGREVVCSPLRIVKGRFTIDFDDLERWAQGCKALILSNPHNPAGTLWSADELRRVAEICSRHELWVISDEIHADLTLAGRHHISYSTVSEEAKAHSITFMAPSKTFNIAGLSSSVCYVGDEALRKRFFNWLDGNGVAGGHILAYVGAEAAFAEGREWLSQLLEYLQGNVELLRDFLTERMLKVKAVLPEASFLAWLDFRSYGLSHAELQQRLLKRARVALNDGTTFGGDDYECCFRINIGCPRKQLLECLERIAAALD